MALIPLPLLRSYFSSTSTMKLRIRSVSTKQTQRVTLPDAASLSDLKSLIASPNLDPDSVHLSLNRTDELVAPNPAHSLKDLGLTTGDLIFFSSSPFSAQNLIVSRVPVVNADFGTGGSDLVQVEGCSGDSDNLVEGKLTRDDQSVELMEIDAETTDASIIERKPYLIPEFLVNLMELGGNEDSGVMNRIVKITHAALLDMGFVLVNESDGSDLPPNWSSNSANLDLKYTIPTLMDPAHAFNADKIASLKFSIDGNFATIYGYFSSDFYRICLNLGKLATLLTSNPNSMNENEQNQILEIFRVLKDGIALPLMIDLCLKNNIQLPPCFTRLSTDIKTNILDLISGADVASLGSTCHELRTLSQDENLWKRKLEEEFPADVSTTSSQREKYRRAFVGRRERRERELRRENEMREVMRRRRERWTGGGFVGPMRPGFGIIGGNYDRFPVIGDGSGLYPLGRSMSPRCNFGLGGDGSSRRFFDGI